MTNPAPRTHRLLAAITITGLLALAACGSDSDSSAADSTVAPTTTAAAAPESTAETTGTAGTAVPDPADVRIIETVNGPIEVPTDPKRIVVTGYNETEDLLALGIEPIAVAFEPPSFYPEFDYELVMNDAFELQLEQIAALEPDLIIGVEWSTQSFYDELSQIAPTIVFPTTKFDQWQEMFLATAEVVGKTNEAQTMIDEFDERMDATATEYADIAASATMNFFRPLTGGGTDLQIMGNGEFHDFFFDALGIRHSEAVESATSADGESRIEAPLEQLELLDADVVFRGRFGSRDAAGEIVAADDVQAAANAYADELTTNPLWANLTAVQSGHVVDVPVENWNEGRVIAAGLIVDDIIATLDALSAES